MAKKHYGRLIAFAAAAGALTAGISYFLRYRSFHDELDEDFHDFEDDFDEETDKSEKNAAAPRNYVSLTPDRTEEKAVKEEASEAAKDITPAADERNVPESVPTAEAADYVSKEETKENAGEEPKEMSDTTTIVEDTTE